MKLAFGKFKGQEFTSTPVWYQNWLVKQDWFKPTIEKPLHHQLNGWDGYSRKGETIYDAIFEQEKKEMAEMDCKIGICSCCPDSKYYGM
jgi:hypothetical protein